MKTRKDTQARRTKMALSQTADEAYAQRRADIAVLMDCIQMELDDHGKRAAAKPKDWGRAGDLGHIRETMTDVLRFLLIGRHGWSETEAARFIEDHLERVRR